MVGWLVCRLVEWSWLVGLWDSCLVYVLIGFLDWLSWWIRLVYLVGWFVIGLFGLVCRMVELVCCLVSFLSVCL